MDPDPLPLHTARLALRNHRPNDLDAVREYLHYPEVHRFESQTVPSEESIQDWLQRALDWTTARPRTHYALAATLHGDDRAVGRLLITRLPYGRDVWEMGWTMHPQLWGQGLATEAAREGLRFAFQDLGAHRVVAFCNSNNTASERVMQKLGMFCEARMREERWWNGGWTDELMYAILEHEWRERKT